MRAAGLFLALAGFVIAVSFIVGAKNMQRDIARDYVRISCGDNLSPAERLVRLYRETHR